VPISEPIRVLVAVRDPVTALGLHSVLSTAPGIVCEPLPEDVEDVRALVEGTSPDVLLLDVELRRADPELLPDLAASHSATKVLVYVDHSPEECALRHMLELGGKAHLSRDALARLDDCCLTSLRQSALGCVGAGVDLLSVVNAVRAVARGEVAAAPWLACLARIVHGPPDKAREGSPISVRELEVMTLLAEGLSNKQIARRLGIREQTVKNHVTRTMEKLGVENRTEVGLLAARHNLRLIDEGEGRGR
jgi:DNA-binding NarL/FixJ family response regulator